MENERASGVQVRETQADRVLAILQAAKKTLNPWVDGMIFLRLDRPITQFHSRIFHLQSLGYKIEGRFIEGKNWKEYRLVDELGN